MASKKIDLGGSSVEAAVEDKGREAGRRDKMVDTVELGSPGEPESLGDRRPVDVPIGWDELGGAA